MDYYQILELTNDCTKEKIKKQYHNLSKKYHPDKLTDLGKEHLKGAKEKFQQIQDAYEKIKNERGF